MPKINLSTGSVYYSDSGKGIVEDIQLTLNLFHELKWLIFRLSFLLKKLSQWSGDSNLELGACR
ncbi:MAG: hypothetical protein COB04_19035 [Gammaproteobacteria bacterium]|nr:MAG: hypothetical protein COB04_19035 [Gammaproteobacteria bacterium]